MNASVSKIICVLALLVFLFTSGLEAQQTIVKGKLLDANGKPSRHALVGVLSIGSGNAKDFVKCDEKGNYTITLNNPGINNLLFSIPGHHAEKVFIFNNANKELTVDVTLAFYKYKDSFDGVGIIGDFNGFNIASPESMTKREDGTYLFEVKTDKPTVKYQLCKIEAANRSINAPSSNGFEPDSSGDYRSIIPAKDGKAVIVFDPAKLNKGDGKAQVTYNGDTYSQLIGKELSTMENLRIDISTKTREYVEKNKNLTGFEYTDDGTVKKMLQKAEEEKVSELHEFYKLIYVSFGSSKIKDYDYGKAAQFYDSVPPQSIMWELMPQAYYSYYSLIPQFRWKENEEKFLKESKSKIIKLGIYTNKLANAKFSGNTEELTKLHETISQNFGDLEQAKQILKQFPIETKIKIGVEIPDFEIVSIDNKNEKFTKQQLLGKIYMIDFWATWCGPCVAEMESLHNVFEKFKEKGFEIVSMSLDASENDVVKFRGDKWKMPWKNSFIGDKEGKKIASAFEVIGIPKPILVGKDGKIIAMDGEMRGTQLEKTLAKYFQ